MPRFLSPLLAPLSLIARLFLSGVEPDAAGSGDNGSILDPNG
ncbi:MAG TPA: hypothetical protein VFR31_02605 [Thermoanaerobaculia bacterium]|nr:hypothetical protein [Thermoanaerobaculia bacterium]